MTSAESGARHRDNRSGESAFLMRAHRDERYQVVYRSDILSVEDSTFADTLRRQRATLVVTTPSVDALYGARLRRYLAARCANADISSMVLECSESRKGMDEVLAVCERAAVAGLARRSQIVSFGGGVSMDICGLAAALFRRGIPHVRVPTTLIGMIDAGIGVKNGINFGGKKSLLGTFAAPEVSILDPSFLASLPRRHLQCGLAESVKVASVSSRELFELLEAHGRQLLGDSFRAPPETVRRVIQLSVTRMLDELQLNLFERPELFERSYARRLDFGHTFSPYIEETSSHQVLHGEAVSIDIALSGQIASHLGLLDEASVARLLALLLRLDLPIYWVGIDAKAMHTSLESIAKHRDGKLNLVLPTGIGRATFLEDLSDLSPTVLEEALRTLRERRQRVAWTSPSARMEDRDPRIRPEVGP